MFSKLVLLIAATIPLASAADEKAADVKVVEEIVAKVNGEIITSGELEHNREVLEQDLRNGGLAGTRLQDEMKARDKDLLRDQIDQLLMVQRGKDMDLKVDGEVTKRLADIQSQAKIVDPDEFHKYLQQQTGMSFEDFKQQMTNQALTQKVISEDISSRINIPEADLRKYYDAHKTDFMREEEVFLSQIVISLEGKNAQQVEAAEKKAKDLVIRARNGEKFSDLAKANSDDTETAQSGGQLPPYKRSEGLMRKEMADIVFAQKKGYVTDPLKIDDPPRLVILRIDEHYQAGQADFDEVKDDVMQRLAAPLLAPKIREYLTKLRQDAYLQIKDGYVDSGAAPGKNTKWADAIELKPETTTKEEVAAHQKKKLLWMIPVSTIKETPSGSSANPASPPSDSPAPASSATPPKTTAPNSNDTASSSAAPH
jgi:peptidyl-prolyl cis-trans isomerase SurA